MDDADRAQNLIEASIEEAIERHARGIRPHGVVARTHCEECGDLLAAHRRAYGLCIDCARDHEARMRTITRGAM